LRWFAADAIKSINEAGKTEAPDAAETQQRLQRMRDKEGVIRDRGYATQDEVREGR
jgi:hypothetical protein